MVKDFLKRIFGFIFRYSFRWSFKLDLLPFCRNFGTDRGGSLSRYYVDRFIRKYSDRIEGRVLEFGDNHYQDFFQSSQILSYEVFDVKAGSGVTLVGDIQDCPNIATASFDAVICTQVLEHVFQPVKGLDEIYRILKPGGILLLSLPFYGAAHLIPNDYWRFTPFTFKKLLDKYPFRELNIDFEGNLCISIMYLLGLGISDTHQTMLDKQSHHDPLELTCFARK